MKILIDNSTYYSSKSAIQEKLLTADTIYNLATFLECIVVAEKVSFAPTTLWYPDVTDGHLFETDGPCVKLLSVADSDEEAKRIFVRSIEESLEDLNNSLVREQFETTVIQEALSLLSDYRLKAQENPSKFMELYSGLVYLTDEGTSTYFEQTFGKESKSLSEGQHLTNYLLRSNVAMEMSDRLAYHPHSQRVPLVCAKMSISSRQSPALATALIRDVEAEIKQNFTANEREILELPFKPFTHIDRDSQLPLVLAVVLSGADAPDKIIPRALQLRRLPQARDYRDWLSKLATAIRKPDITARNEAYRQVLEAQEVLSKELRKLYGIRQKGIPSRWSQLTSVVDPKEIIGASTRSILLKASQEALRRGPNALKWWKEFSIRRRIALLITLAKERQKIDNLNSLLARTFHKQLSDDQLKQLYMLQENHTHIMSELVRNVQWKHI